MAPQCSQSQNPNEVVKLTVSQKNVLRLLAKGWTMKEDGIFGTTYLHKSGGLVKRQPELMGRLMLKFFLLHNILELSCSSKLTRTYKITDNGIKTLYSPVNAE